MCKLETSVRRNERFQAPSDELPLEDLSTLKIMEIKPSCSGLSIIQDGCQGSQNIRKSVDAFLSNGQSDNSETPSHTSKSTQRPNVAFCNIFEEKIFRSLK